jgi:hypothetical protein
MSIKKIFLLTTALYASQHNGQLVAMSTLPAEVQNLIFCLLPMRSQLNFMETAKCYTKLHERNIPTRCSGCAINTNEINTSEDVVTKIEKIAISGPLTIKGPFAPEGIFNLKNQTSITDLHFLDYKIIPEQFEFLVKNLSPKNVIRTLTIGKGSSQDQRLYIDIKTMTSMLKSMPHLKECVLSHVALHCDDEDPCDEFSKLGGELFRIKQVEIYNSSVGPFGTSWLEIALRESKSIEKLTLSNIYITPIIPSKGKDNYTGPVVLTGDKSINFINCMNNCKTMRQLTLDREIYIRR